MKNLVLVLLLAACGGGEPHRLSSGRYQATLTTIKEDTCGRAVKGQTEVDRLIVTPNTVTWEDPGGPGYILDRMGDHIGAIGIPVGENTLTFDGEVIEDDRIMLDYVDVFHGNIECNIHVIYDVRRIGD